MKQPRGEEAPGLRRKEWGRPTVSLLPLCTLRGEVSYKMAEAKLLEVWRGTGRCVCLRSGEESVRPRGRSEARRSGAISRPSAGGFLGLRAGQPWTERPGPGRAPSRRLAPRGSPCLSSPPPSRSPNTSKELPGSPPTPSLPTSSPSLFLEAQDASWRLPSLKVFLWLPSPNAPPGPRRTEGDPPPHGWPKMENAQRRKMEAPRLRVAFCVPSSPPGAS